MIPKFNVRDEGAMSLRQCLISQNGIFNLCLLHLCKMHVEKLFGRDVPYLQKSQYDFEKGYH